MSVVGIGGALAPISPERLAELRVVQEGFRSVIDEFIANGRTLPLEMSYHAPGNRKAEFKASRRGMSVKIRKNNSKVRITLLHLCLAFAISILHIHFVLLIFLAF